MYYFDPNKGQIVDVTCYAGMLAGSIYRVVFENNPLGMFFLVNELDEDKWTQTLGSPCVRIAAPSKDAFLQELMDDVTGLGGAATLCEDDDGMTFYDVAATMVNTATISPCDVHGYESYVLIDIVGMPFYGHMFHRDAHLARELQGVLAGNALTDDLYNELKAHTMTYECDVIAMKRLCLGTTTYVDIDNLMALRSRLYNRTPAY